MIALATTNVGKARELARLLAVPVEPLDGWEPPEEDGETFEANALHQGACGARPGAAGG